MKIINTIYYVCEREYLIIYFCRKENKFIEICICKYVNTQIYLVILL